MKQEVLILGAGPAGISCAYELGQKRISAVVVERHDRAGGPRKEYFPAAENPGTLGGL